MHNSRHECDAAVIAILDINPPLLTDQTTCTMRYFSFSRQCVTTSLGTTVPNGRTVHSPDDINGSENLWLTGDTEKRVVVPHRLPQIPHGLPLEHIRVGNYDNGLPSTLHKYLQIYIHRPYTELCLYEALVLTAARVQTVYFGDVSPCWFINGHRCFGLTCCPTFRVA